MKMKLTSKKANKSGKILVIIPAGKIMGFSTLVDTLVTAQEWDDTILTFNIYDDIPIDFLYKASLIINADSGKVYKNKYKVG